MESRVKKFYKPKKEYLTKIDRYYKKINKDSDEKSNIVQQKR